MADDTTSTPDAQSAPAAAESDRVAALTAEVGDLKDRVLRTLAEMDNLRKRTEREIADSRQYSIANFAREVLTVGDNLKRAIDAVPAEARKADPALSNLMDGVEATERSLEQTLKKFGVRPIEAKGQKFDADFHQAMYEIERPDMPSGHVAEVVQGGYVIGERVLRPAMVAISRGGPKQLVPANDDSATADS